MKYDGIHDLELKSAKIGTNVGEGIGNLANIINQASNRTGIKANWNVLESANSSIEAGSVTGLNINGIEVGTLNDIKNNNSEDIKLFKEILLEMKRISDNKFAFTAFKSPEEDIFKELFEKVSREINVSYIDISAEFTYNDHFQIGRAHV